MSPRKDRKRKAPSRVPSSPGEVKMQDAFGNFFLLREERQTQAALRCMGETLAQKMKALDDGNRSVLQDVQALRSTTNKVVDEMASLAPTMLGHRSEVLELRGKLQDTQHQLESTRDDLSGIPRFSAADFQPLLNPLQSKLEEMDTTVETLQDVCHTELASMRADLGRAVAEAEELGRTHDAERTVLRKEIDELKNERAERLCYQKIMEGELSLIRGQLVQLEEQWEGRLMGQSNRPADLPPLPMQTSGLAAEGPPMEAGGSSSSGCGSGSGNKRNNAPDATRLTAPMGKRKRKIDEFIQLSQEMHERYKSEQPSDVHAVHAFIFEYISKITDDRIQNLFQAHLRKQYPEKVLKYESGLSIWFQDLTWKQVRRALRHMPID